MKFLKSPFILFAYPSPLWGIGAVESDQNPDLSPSGTSPEASLSGASPLEDFLRGTSQKVQKTLDTEGRDPSGGYRSLVETEREKFENFVGGIKQEKQEKEYERVKPLFGFWKKWFLRGRTEKDPQSGESVRLPGIQDLSQAQEETQLQRDQLQEILTPFQGFDTAQGLLKKRESLREHIASYDREYALQSVPKPPYYETLKEQEQDLNNKIAQSVSSVIASWVASQEKLNQIKNDFEAITQKHVGTDQKIGDILQNQYIDPLAKTLGTLESKISETDIYLSSEDDFFKKVKSQIKTLEDFMDFEDHYWGNQKGLLTQDFTGANETLQYLQDQSFFDEQGRKEFVENFQQKQSDFHLQIDRYVKVLDKLEQDFEWDVDKLTVKQFFDKYGTDKKSFLEKLERYRENRGHFLNAWDKIQDPDFLTDLVEAYEADPTQEIHNEKRAKAIQTLSQWKIFENHLPEIEKGTKNLEDFWADQKKHQDMPLNVAHIPRIAQNFPEVAQQKWQKIDEWMTQGWYFYSLSDLFKMIKTSTEAFKRREERRSERAQARLGADFWNGPGKMLFGKDTADLIASEFNRRALEANMKRVKEYEDAFENQKGWELWATLDATSDPDKGQACINKLNELGVLRWDDPVLWRFINRIKGREFLKMPEDYENLDWEQLVAKVRTALSEIYSLRAFDQWYQTMDGKRKSAQSEWDRDFEENVNRKDEVLVGMLQNWSKGKMETVDPTRYENYLKNAFEQGQLNGQPDRRFYYIIMGVTIKNPHGQPLLSRSAISRFSQEQMGVFPHIEFFADGMSYKKDGWVVPEGTPGAQIKPWDYHDYQTWYDYLTVGGTDTDFDPTKEGSEVKKRVGKFFYNNVHRAKTRDRVGRNQRTAGKNADQDDAWAYFAEWTDAQTKTHLQSQSSGEGKSSEDFWRNYARALPDYARYMYNYIKEGDEKWGESEFWIKERESALLEVGSRLKVAMVTIQSLAGNYNPVSRDSVVMSKEEWEKPETAYSPSLIKSREKINLFMEHLFDEVDGGKEFEKILEYNGYENGRNRTELDKFQGANDDFKAIHQASNKLLSNESTEGGGRYFYNTEAIKRALDKYIQDIGGI